MLPNRRDHCFLLKRSFLSPRYTYPPALSSHAGDMSIEFFTKDLRIDRDVLITFYHKNLKKKMFSLCTPSLIHAGLPPNRRSHP